MGCGVCGERLVRQEHVQVDDAQKRQVSRNLMLYNHLSKLYIKGSYRRENTTRVYYEGQWGNALQRSDAVLARIAGTI